MEARGDLLATVVQKQAEGNWNIKVNAQDIGFDGGAKANCSLEIGQVFNECAAWGLGWGSNHKVHQVIQQVSTNSQFEGVFGALGLWVLVAMAAAARGFWWWRARDISWANHCEEEKIEKKQKGSWCSSSWSHFLVEKGFWKAWSNYAMFVNTMCLLQSLCNGKFVSELWFL